MNTDEMMRGLRTATAVELNEWRETLMDKIHKVLGAYDGAARREAHKELSAVHMIENEFSRRAMTRE